MKKKKRKYECFPFNDTSQYNHSVLE